MGWNRNTPRRAMAMMLVLVSVMIGTILATAYVASRDNSATIGANSAASTSARWAAASSLDLSLAIMQTQTDWRINHVSGKLLDDYAMGSTTIDLDVVDLITGLPPTADSSHLKIFATATAGGITQTATAIVHVSVAPSEAPLAVDLGEFAVFVSDRMELRNSATIAHWVTAPLSGLGKRLVIGTQGTAAMSVVVRDTAAAIDTTVYHGPGASGSLVMKTSGPAIEQIALLDQIPLPAPPTPAAMLPEIDGMIYPDMIINSTTTLATNARYLNFQASTPGGIVTLQGDIVVVVENDLDLLSGSVLVIDGNVELDIFGDLTLTSAAIELMPNATLTVYLRDDMYLNASYIGDVRADGTRDNSGEAPWMDPQRIRMFTLPLPATGDDEGLSTQHWRLDKNSVIKGSLYNPHARMLLALDCAMYGRVCAERFELQDNAALFYDHSLDTGFGYTNADSPLYDAGGFIKSEVQLLSSLDADSLAALSDALGVQVQANGDTVTGGLFVAPLDEPQLPGEPTPRPVPVEYQFVSFGTDMHEWEAK